MSDLKAFRNELGLTQAEMADKMGMPLRSYQDIEGDKNPVRPVHMAAARYARWAINEEKRLKSTLPRRFFLVRFSDHSGKWSVPWSVWAENYPDAIARFYNLATVEESIEIQIRLSDDYANGKEFPHSVDHQEAVFEHRGKEWPD